MSKYKYFYFFRGDLTSHVDIYKSTTDSIKEHLNIELLTIISSKDAKSQSNLVEYYNRRGVKILIAPLRLTKIYAALYFLCQLFRYDRIVVQLKKQSVSLFVILSAISFGKIKYILDIEGDFESEADYLSDPKNSFKKGFYVKAIRDMRRKSQKILHDIRNADGVVFCSEDLRTLFDNRIPQTGLLSKSISIPTSFDSNRFFFQASLRKAKRDELGLNDKFVILYSGNAFYSWQNVSKVVRFYAKVCDLEMVLNPFLVLLIRQKDIEIARGFLEKYSIPSSRYILTSVPHEEMNSYLNASDLAVLFRDDHQMNKVASPGKLGEYLAAGCNVLTTKHIGVYSNALYQAEYPALIDDLNSMDHIISTFNILIRENGEISRYYFSQWVRTNFSSQAYSKRYMDFLKSVATS